MKIDRAGFLLLTGLLGSMGAGLTGGCSDDEPTGGAGTSVDSGATPSDSAPTPTEASIAEAGPQDATVSDGEAGITCVGGPFPAQTPSGTCSLNSGQALGLTFENNSARAVSIYWVDYSCGEVLQAALQPCETFTISSWVSHPWRIRDVTTGTLYKEFIPTSTAVTKVTLQ